MATGFKTIEKKYGVKVVSEGHWYNPLTGRSQETFNLYSADGCCWEKGLSRKRVKAECEEWAEALLEIKRKTDYIKRKASMDRADAFQRCWDLAVEIAHTGVYGDNRSELEDLAYEFDIFVCYTDDGIAVEDEMAYFTYQ